MEAEYKLREMMVKGLVRNILQGSPYCCNIERGYICTQRNGHRGPHIADGPFGPILEWPNDKA